MPKTQWPDDPSARFLYIDQKHYFAGLARSYQIDIKQDYRMGSQSPVGADIRDITIQGIIQEDAPQVETYWNEAREELELPETERRYNVDEVADEIAAYLTDHLTNGMDLREARMALDEVYARVMGEDS